MATATYADQATVKNNGSFLDRCSVALAKYAKFIIGEDPATQFHTFRADWAKSALQNPLGETQKIIFFAIWDPAITGLTSPVNQASIDGITDAVLQTVIETAINNTVLKF